ncbi:MAG: hypothetical protein ACK2UK_00910, partial [Candidatus Promineifilaceae bacterium]
AEEDWATYWAEYIMQKARQFPFRNAPGYALSYARQAIANALVSDGKRIGTWGPRYQGIDEDVTHHGVLITCAIQWSQCIEAADMGLLPCSPEQLLPIKYEMLVSQPQRELQRVAQWLDLDMAPYRDLADRIAVSAENIGKGRRLLSQTQVATIEPHIEHAMELIGNAR